jgi:hypothetical protein
MPRFVILRHENPQGVHFDFMLESGGALKTWTLAQPPQAGAEIPCETLPDHRLAYLDYEGPISGGRGSVTRWDRGIFTIQRQSEAECVVKLAGEKVAGTVTLLRFADVSNRWSFWLSEENNK